MTEQEASVVEWRRMKFVFEKNENRTDRTSLDLRQRQTETEDSFPSQQQSVKNGREPSEVCYQLLNNQLVNM